ncbi:unnamed protein product [Cunninghamella blakesleeana]
MAIKLIYQLRLFHISFHADKHISRRRSFLYWPNYELLKYLYSNPPAKLKTLGWSTTIYHSAIQKRTDLQHHGPLYQEIQPIPFIHQFEKLHLSLLYMTNEILNYLLDGQEKRTLTNIKELFISPIEILNNVKPQLHLYKRLDGFPNLQSLSINGMNLITFEPFINEDKHQQQQNQSKYKLKKNNHNVFRYSFLRWVKSIVSILSSSLSF